MGGGRCGVLQARELAEGFLDLIGNSKTPDGGKHKAQGKKRLRS